MVEQGKRNNIVPLSSFVLLMILFCLPCFAQQTLKQIWDIPVVEINSVFKLKTA